MKHITLFIVANVLWMEGLFAQTNTFPTTGNVGVGTITPSTLFQVQGGIAQFGGTVDYSRFAADGDLTFTGLADYLVGGDRYAFRYSGNQNFGLVFSATSSRYEFRDGSAAQVFWVTGAGNGYFKSKLAIGSTVAPGAALDITATTAAGIKLNPFGAGSGNTLELRFLELAANGTNYIGFKAPNSIAVNYIWTLPAADGTSGQVLSTNGAGVLNWVTPAGGAVETDPQVGSTLVNMVPKWNGSTLVDGLLFDNGTSIGIGTTTPEAWYKMEIAGGDIKVNSLRIGRGGYSHESNTAFGYGVLGANNTGLNNTGVGYLALSEIWGGGENTAVGAKAMNNASGGSYNTAVGYEALYLYAGNGNTAIGWKSLRNITNDGYYNTGIGFNALYNNTGGDYNIAVGADAVKMNTTGNDNIGIGRSAIYSNTTGFDNIGIGDFALYQVTIGYGNVALGSMALNTITGNSYATAIGNHALTLNTAADNTALGAFALQANTTGQYNTAVGKSAGYSNTSSGGNTYVGRQSGYFSTGQYNTYLGDYSGANSTTGNNNTFVGKDAGLNNTTGGNNTALGQNASVSAGNLTNTTVIGYNAVVAASNQVSLGNSTVNSIGGWANWTNFSDKRVKKDVRQDVPGLEFIRELKPVTYHYDVDAIASILHTPDSMRLRDGEAVKSAIMQTGFLAQDVDAAAQKIGYDFSGVDRSGELLGLRYAEFVVPLTKATQELDELVVKQQSQIKVLQQQIIDLTAIIAQSGLADGAAVITTSINNSSGPMLGQNIPNPYDQTTLIPFRIPKDCKDASIMVSDIGNGRVVTAIPLDCNETHITFEAAMLPSGTYSYSLIVDGEIVGTREMLLTK